MAGIKHDRGKPRVDLVPPRAILEVAKVLTDGVEEYGEHNWRQGIAYSRLYAAIQRHLLAFWKSEDVDGSGHRALAHACTDIMMLMEMPEEWDDRLRHYCDSSGCVRWESQEDRAKRLRIACHRPAPVLSSRSHTVISVIAYHFGGYTGTRVTPSTSLAHDLKLNNDDLLDLAILLEDEFNIRIVEAGIEKLKTVQDAIDLVEKGLNIQLHTLEFLEEKNHECSY